MDNMDQMIHRMLTIGQNLVWFIGFLVLLLFNWNNPWLPLFIFIMIVAINTYNHHQYYTYHGVAEKAKIYLVVMMVLTFFLLIVDQSTFEQLFILVIVGDVILGYSIKFSLIFTSITYLVSIPYYIYAYSDLSRFNYEVSIFRDLLIAVFVIIILYLAKNTITISVVNKQLLKEKKESYDKLSKYLNKIEDLAVLEERNRIALILHNSIGHALTSIMLGLQAEKRERMIKDGLDEEAFESIENQIQEALNLLRKTISSSEDFYSNIEFDFLMDMFIKNTLNNTTTRIEYERSGNKVIPSFYNNVCFNIIMEAVTNALKHSRCDLIKINIYVAHHIDISIVDNGIGFNQLVYGYGMTKTKELIEKFHGVYQVESQNGCVVRARIPLER